MEYNKWKKKLLSRHTMFKCIHGLAPLRLCNDLEMFCDRNSYWTRNADSLNVILPQVNRAISKQVLKFSGAKRWNDIPNFIQNAQTVDSFKLLYKQLYFKL